LSAEPRLRTEPRLLRGLAVLRLLRLTITTRVRIEARLLRLTVLRLLRLTVLRLLRLAVLRLLRLAVLRLLRLTVLRLLRLTVTARVRVEARLPTETGLLGLTVALLRLTGLLRERSAGHELRLAEVRLLARTRGETVAAGGLIHDAILPWSCGECGQNVTRVLSRCKASSRGSGSAQRRILSFSRVNP
jgi:hypothetical protein